MNGTLFLIPSTLGEASSARSLPQDIPIIAGKLHHFVVEDLRTARRFLKKILPGISIDSLTFYVLNEHTLPGEISSLLAPLLEGHDMGLLSEAGLPCVADPGALLVSHAHENGIKVVPVSGPSSVFLALMASGFNGQNFAFHGYLPIDKKEKIKKIRELESAAYKQDQTQIFIETPYRNQQLLEALLEACQPQTRICIAYDLTLPGETITTSTTKWFNSNRPDIRKKPAVFLLYR
jgi:16S rRNA (cytidine1402-2'-O)-methyltransferase